MKRSVGLTDQEAHFLHAVSNPMERHFPGRAERFCEPIPHHADAAKVFTGGQEQINRLKQTLQAWARGLLGGRYDEDYAAVRYEIGVRPVWIGLPRCYMISAMALVRDYLQERLASELWSEPQRLEATKRAFDKVLNLGLNMMCESYFQESMGALSALNRMATRPG